MPIAPIAQSAADRMVGPVTRRPTFTTHLGAVDRMAMSTRVASVQKAPAECRPTLGSSFGLGMAGVNPLPLIIGAAAVAYFLLKK